MTRKFVDCREFHSKSKCTLAMSADTEDELMEAAIQHAVAVHGYKESAELRELLRKGLRDEAPPARAAPADA